VFSFLGVSGHRHGHYFFITFWQRTIILAKQRGGKPGKGQAQSTGGRAGEILGINDSEEISVYHMYGTQTKTKIMIPYDYYPADRRGTMTGWMLEQSDAIKFKIKSDQLLDPQTPATRCRELYLYQNHAYPRLSRNESNIFNGLADASSLPEDTEARALLQDCLGTSC
jgi:hypothetical protein